MLAFWWFEVGSAYEPGRSDERFGPVKLIVWTIIAVAVAAAGLGVKLLLFGGPPVVGWAVAVVPLMLPMVGALAHRPPRRWLGLLVAVLFGALVGIAVGTSTASPLGSLWSGFVGLSSAFLVGAVGFALVTRSSS
ncbi:MULTISPECIES: hypothetical protein [Thermomonosporaceae]|uniref:hypothetical protein n=1 Tax=Thermomonosporaceae TaxID=2012 RepID=UPI00255B2517|nr:MULTISPECIES: hypothetical protein [Thermomonosporaceae]MDL4773850.1 hypothetical protein [Actinomadura xylanilytica]